MLNELVSWWARQMLDLVPQRWRQSAPGPANATVVAWRDAGGDVELFNRREHRETSLGRFPRDDGGWRMARAALGKTRPPATVLRLPAGYVLERQISLPLAAEQGLDRVVRYEMDRFTPFSAEEVFWSCAVQRRDRAQGKLAAGIALVPLMIDAHAPGKEILHPVAVTIFGGLISATLLDTALTPVLFLRYGRKSLESLVAQARNTAEPSQSQSASAKPIEAY
jgi:hypothetical protein